jgi:hypothetical protein
MSNLINENALYDTGHAAVLLNLDEHTLMGYIHQLSLSPRVDESTGNLVLTQRDIEILKKATRSPNVTEPVGDDKPKFNKRFGGKPSSTAAASHHVSQQAGPMTGNYPENPDSGIAVSPSQTSGSSSNASAFMNSVGNSVANNRSSLHAQSPSGGEKKENLALIVEAVSQAKEGILKDLAKLLDDKLAGLDEVVVELIRCKSENDTLKQKLKTALDEKETLRFELSKFKPVQFGFYRKVN